MSSCMSYPLGLHMVQASDIHHASRHARLPAAIQRFERTGHLASTAGPQEMAVGAGFRINPCHGLLQMFQMDDVPLAGYMSQSSNVTPASIYFTRWMWPRYRICLRGSVTTDGPGRPTFQTFICLRCRVCFICFRRRIWPTLRRLSGVGRGSGIGT